MQNGTHCQSSTSAVTCAPGAQGCITQTTSSCNSGDFCQGPYPSSQCKPPTPLGFYSYLGSTQPHTANFLAGFKITTTNAVTLYKFGLIAKNISGAPNVRFALYRDNGSGVPGTLVASSTGLALVNDRNETTPTQSGIALSAATNYFILAVFDVSTDIGDDGTAASTTHFRAMNYGLVFPSTLNDGTNPTMALTGVGNNNYYILVY
jgi:hypothetical protein